MIRSILVAANLLLLTWGSVAADFKIKIPKVQIPKIALPGTTITPTVPLPIKENPPGFFQGAGTQLGEAKPGDNLVVLEQRTVPTVIGRDEWLKVQNASNPAETGWIPAGPAVTGDSNVRLPE